MKHNDPKLFKDTFWNNERVKRNLKLSDISKYLNVPYGTVGSWFCGKVMPKETIIIKLCDWFSEMLPDDPISFADGERQFKVAHLTWQGEHHHTLKAHGTDQDDEGGKFMGGRKVYKTEVGKFIRDHGIKHKDLAEYVGVPLYTISHWVSGRYLPNEVNMSKMALKLETNVDILSDLFSKAHNDYHNVQGQKTIDEAVIESHDDMDEDAKQASIPYTYTDTQVDISTRQEIDNALNNRTRFVQWSELFNKVLFARVDIVAHLMYLYTEWGYSMWDAIEALSHERNDIPFWVLRTIILQAERVNYFGENDEGGKDNE